MDIFNRPINEEDLYMLNAELNLTGCKFVGEGRNGKVFLMPDSKVIKICRTPKSCSKEYKILEKVNGSKYFPRVYYKEGTYMIREYIGGEPLKKYIKENGLSRQLTLKLIELFEEFESLGFTKIDIRVRDIFIDDDLTLKVIDPRASFTRKVNYPRHFMRGLKRLGAVGWFKRVISEERPDLYQKWIVDNNLVDPEFGY